MILFAEEPRGSGRPAAEHHRRPVRGRRLFVIAGAAALAMTAAACGGGSSGGGSDASSGSADTSPYTIGAILDLTGPTAASDAFQLQGIKLAIKQVNDAGGINGHQLELKTADDAANPAQDGPAYQRLVEQGHAVALLGPTISGDVQAVLTQQQRSGVYVPVMGIGGDPSLFEGDNNKWYFGASQNVKLFAEQEVKALMEHSAVANKNFGVIYSDIAAAKSSADFAKAEVKAEGGTFSSEPSVGLTQTDMLPQLQKMKNAGVNQVIGDLITSPPTILAFLHGIAQLNWKVQWLLPDIGLSEIYGTVPNSLLEGGMVGNICDPRTSSFKQMLSDYKAMFGKTAPPSSYDSLGAMYGGAKTLFAAMDQAADASNADQVLAALNATSGATNYCGADPITLNENKHWLNDNYPFAHIVDGKKVFY
jgi:branched-chain amino acid transport system substrate-binding protein